MEKQVVVGAPVAEVWAAWTTAEGCATFFAPRARVRAEPGGPYELLFDDEQPPGKQGSEGCVVLEVEPERRLAFSWNNPPHLAAIRDRHTRVDLRLAPEDAGRTRVTLVHSGFGAGGEWDQAHAYFERAWDIVARRLAVRFERGPIDWRAP